jgi:hypothetical protein
MKKTGHLLHERSRLHPRQAQQPLISSFWLLFWAEGVAHMGER